MIKSKAKQVDASGENTLKKNVMRKYTKFAERKYAFVLSICTYAQ